MMQCSTRRPKRQTWFAGQWIRAYSIFMTGSALALELRVPSRSREGLTLPDLSRSKLVINLPTAKARLTPRALPS